MAQDRGAVAREAKEDLCIGIQFGLCEKPVEIAIKGADGGIAIHTEPDAAPVISESPHSGQQPLDLSGIIVRESGAVQVPVFPDAHDQGIGSSALIWDAFFPQEPASSTLPRFRASHARLETSLKSCGFSFANVPQVE